MSSNELLTLDDIAELWRVDRERARRYIVRLPEFPHPAIGSTRKLRRWHRSAVLAFLTQAHENAHESEIAQ